VFEPIDGTDSSLEQTTYGLLRVAHQAGSEVDNLIDLGQPEVPVDPQSYRLTTPEGLVFDIDQAFGIRKITEPNGNTLSYSSSGVVHSSGLGVSFLRDASGRIRDIVLPDGEMLSYTYSAAGDLSVSSDALNQVTQYGYTNTRHPHYLTEITDPRGVRAIRNEYDDNGRLVRTLDADGNAIEYTHDITGRTERVKDRRGNTSLIEYDESGRVLSETNALGETTRHAYDEEGNELSRVDPLSHETAWTYDARGNALTERNARGEITTSTYDARNGLVTQHDPRGVKVLENAYNPLNGALVSMKDALGNETRFTYDSSVGSQCESGELLSIVDAANATTRYEIDTACRGWRKAEVDALGNRTVFTHDAMGRVASETRSRIVAGATEQLVSRYTYDDKGRVTRTDQPDGSFTTTEYNAIDKPERECDSAGRCTVTTYDARGQVARIEHTDGTVETMTYDANGNALTQTDRDGRTTRMVYDAADRLIETIHPDATVPDGNDANNPRTRNAYDAAGRLTSSTDERGNATRYEYDEANRRTKLIEAVVDGNGAVTETHYDAAGRRAAVVDALGRTTRFVYDDAGRLAETIHPDATPHDDADNPRTRVEYDSLGRKAAEVDENGRRTEYRYDALGRLKEVHLGVGTATATVTKYGYDESGNRTEQTDAENRTTRFAFDSVGREIARTLPLGQRESKAYRDTGELSAHTDFLGQTTQWSYDDAGRVATIDYPSDPDVSFSYTSTGQRASALIAGGAAPTRYGYDRRDRLVTKTDAEGRTIEYRYDAAGNLTRRATANQAHTYDYDALNRLTRVVSTIGTEPPRETRYEYDAVGNRKAMISADGVRTEYAYDARNRLAHLAKRTAAALLFAASYTVDASGMRTAVEESDASGIERTLAFEYDPLKRLTKETIVARDAAQSRTSAWSYDRVGNRLTQQAAVGGASTSTTTTYAYDANDRLLTETTSDQVTTYTYDANGNTKTKQAAGSFTEYRYDDANRLVEMTSGGTRTTYAHDADGLRIAQTEHAGTPTTTHYVQDGTHAYSQVIESYVERDGLPQLRTVFNFADGLLSQTHYASGSTGTRFVHQDGFGSTRLLTDSAASTTDRWSYAAFGNEIAREGTTPVEHLYRGQQFDEKLGLYYLRARYYDANTGRFPTIDPFAGFGIDPSTLHKYAYAVDNPINQYDPTGNLSISWVTLPALLTTTIGRTILWGAAKPLLRRVALAAAVAVAASTPEVRQSPRDRDIPTIWFGLADTNEAAQHYEFSIDMGKKSVLHYSAPGAPKQWYRYKIECKGKSGEEFGTECDEYPFGKTIEGGPGNYPDRVSLRPVNEDDNSRAGTLFSSFLGSCGIAPNQGPESAFKVGTTVGATEWDCGD
jgi:RHS repeat-associated protein